MHEERLSVPSRDAQCSQGANGLRRACRLAPKLWRPFADLPACLVRCMLLEVAPQVGGCASEPLPPTAARLNSANTSHFEIPSFSKIALFQRIMGCPSLDG